MRVEVIQVGYIRENCYFLINDETNETVIVDPGDSADKLVLYAEENQLKPVAILLTHGHYDHTGAVMQLKEHYKIKTYIYKDEKQVLEDKTLHLGVKNVTADEMLEDGEQIILAGFSIKVLHTPGHTPGGCCYYVEEEKMLFSGDTLFFESVGRSDFKGGSTKALVDSVKTKLFVLPDEVVVYPGHMEPTTIEHEKQYNPFVN